MAKGPRGVVKRVVCVCHWKRIQYVEVQKERAGDGSKKRTVVTAPKCNLSGRHSYMYEGKVSQEQFDMYWGQSL
jgi:hypothetical protein